ncbi:competence type IV pilus major pilin ComGC [Sporosarcina luteola]|uniref:competence type IV pilus major pilin ComGC n=1 Tax=Sporosarcina luteola TaxID=582850 RepID=UPI00203C23F2|nr:prepilin-type N-terminal cleavage/methylation domain-containing protein [Sporosarcina luteola]MCM3710761.1 prepilin-type N-terminal cleavage/methylation domain-containing protein [Sporosarcina luteola]
MKKLLQKRLRNEKGLTLVELLAVIVILGIIAAIAVPAIGGIIESSRIKAQFSDGQNVLSAANLYFIENPGADPVTIEELVDGDYLDNAGSFDADNDGTVTYKKGGNELDATTKTEKGKKVNFTAATISNINEADAKEGNSPSVTFVD